MPSRTSVRAERRHPRAARRRWRRPPHVRKFDTGALFPWISPLCPAVQTRARLGLHFTLALALALIMQLLAAADRQLHLDESVLKVKRSEERRVGKECRS